MTGPRSLRCIFGNGACDRPATRRLLVDSPIIRSTGAEILACDYCAEGSAFDLLQMADCRSVISIPIECGVHEGGHRMKDAPGRCDLYDFISLCSFDATEEKRAS